MTRHALLRILLVVTAATATGMAAVAGSDGEADRIAAERRVWQEVTAHINACNACNVHRLMAQHPYVCREKRRDEGFNRGRIRGVPSVVWEACAKGGGGGGGGSRRSVERGRSE